MIKAIWFGVKIALLIALAVWVADHPGKIRIEWMEYAVTVHTGLFAFALLLFILLSIFVYQVIKTFVDFPKSYARYNEIKRKEKGYEALTKGLTAVAAGDTKAAAQHAKKATHFLPEDTGLPLLLEAQAARLDGREEDAAKSFVRLLENKDAGFLGVRGLLQSALDSEDYESALALTDKALALHPKQGWILKITYDLHIRLRQWTRAHNILRRVEKSGALTAEKAKSDRIAIMIAQAEQDIAAGYPMDAQVKLKDAIKLDPNFAPSSVRLAAHYVEEGQRSKAQKVIAKAWSKKPHPALAEAWGVLIPEKKAGEALERLRWYEKLLKNNAQSASGHIAAGQAAMDAGLWGEARAHFKKAEADVPSAELYKLFATLEEKSGGEDEAVQNWLVMSANAPSSKVWVCSQTGRIYGDWSPIAQPHGSFNTIIWDEPFNPARADVIVHDASEMADALIEAPKESAA